jgi:hypothetical protein
MTDSTHRFKIDKLFKKWCQFIYSLISEVRKNSVNKIFKVIRIRIPKISIPSNVFGIEEVENDESYFEAKRVFGLSF